MEQIVQGFVHCRLGEIVEVYSEVTHYLVMLHDGGKSFEGEMELSHGLAGCKNYGRMKYSK